MDSVIRHPLTILLISAIVTGLLVPSVTRRWQDHQKALDIKALLLRQLSEHITRVITFCWFRELGQKPDLNADDRAGFDWRYGEWTVMSQVLQAQLEIYFRRSPDVARHWSEYSQMLRDFYDLTWDKDGRDDLLSKLENRFKDNKLWTIEVRTWRGPSQIHIDRRCELQVSWPDFRNAEDAPRFMRTEFWRLKQAMEAPRFPLAQAILKAPIESLR
ncbi:hypothetical protein [Amycolatopsis alba]|uniref:Uncharacterized protein n=1 Tax=Amycolatopsis alba DSM 44262 TaxID=1125972 RepID=A0A229RA03_AMYAL|nr:hypothetical protein [Amycolatopsis alba]OXM43488.1 hypothetical protein CFP75_37865 [Amycolatopsis alba DSM 44262]